MISDDHFPKANKNKFTGENGVNLVSSIINNELNYLFKVNHSENDFGIDGYIDIVTDTGSVTGQSIAIQIKAGDSFFKQKSPNGYTFYGEKKHLNYYSNNQLPVLIIICDIKNSKCYWQHFDITKIEETNTGWKINIPSNNLFNKDCKSKLQSLLPELVDSSEDLAHQTATNNLFKEHDFLHYAISYEEITNNDISGVKSFFERLSINDSLYLSSQGKVDISVDGYSGDKRELYEIKEVRKWFSKANKKIDQWFFFLSTEKHAFGLILFLICNCRVKVTSDSKRMDAFEVIDAIKSNNTKPITQVELNLSDIPLILDTNWVRLNKITDALGMPIEENKNISLGIISALRNVGFL